MTKAFNKGRTEAIRTVQPNSVAFTKVRSETHLPFCDCQAPNLTSSPFPVHPASSSAQARVRARRLPL